MKEIKNVCVLKFNTGFEPENLYGKEIISDIKITKKKYIINRAFDKTTNIGVATNFIKKDDGLYCDLKFEDGLREKKFTNAYVSIDYNKKEGNKMLSCKLDGVSVGYLLNAQVEIRDNIKGGK